MTHSPLGPAPPDGAPRAARLDPRLERKLALYLMALVLVLVLVGAVAAVGVMGWWSAGLAPVSDGERVLEELRQVRQGAGAGREGAGREGAGSKARP